MSHTINRVYQADAMRMRPIRSGLDGLLQVTDGMAVPMAVMALILGGSASTEGKRT